VSFLRRAFEQRDLVSWMPHTPDAIMGTGYSVPSNWDIGTTSSGVAVNDSAALGVVTYNAGVQLLADSVAGLPWDQFRKRDGRRVEVDPQPSLLVSPSPDMSVFDWKHMAMVSLLMRGNFYGLITERDGLEYPTSILPLHPDSVRIDRDPDTYEKRVWVNDRRYPTRDLFHIPGFRLPGSDMGLSPIGMARHSLGLSLAAQDFGGKWFRDGASPSSVLETDQAMDDNQAKTLQRSWVASHGGRRRPAVLSGGVKWKPITISPEESQFLQTRQHQQLEACQMLRIPPHMLSIVDKSTSWGTGIEQQSIGFVTYTLKPWLDRIEGYLNMVSPRGQFTKFNVDGLLRGDIKSRYEAYRIAVEAGFKNRDEIRAHEDMPPIPGGAGQIFSQPLNFGELGAEPPAPAGPAPIEETDDDDTAA
jgi:HK97 family phage portal protein